MRDYTTSKPLKADTKSEKTLRIKCTTLIDENGKRQNGCSISYEIPTFAFETAAW